MENNQQIESWHSEESRRIELLDWRNNREDFQALCDFARGRIQSELKDRGIELATVIAESELHEIVKVAVANYGEKERRLIGMAIHVSIWLRGYVSEKLRRAAER